MNEKKEPIIQIQSEEQKRDDYIGTLDEPISATLVS